MKKILLAPIAAALLSGVAFANENMSGQKKRSTVGAKAKSKKGKEGFSITSDVYFTDHDTDHYRQTKYALADGIYTLQPLNKKLELYLEGKAGVQSEAYRLENGYATTTGQKMGVYVAAEIGAKYHFLDNVAVGAEVTMLENESKETRGQNIELTLKYSF